MVETPTASQWCAKDLPLLPPFSVALVSKAKVDLDVHIGVK